MNAVQRDTFGERLRQYRQAAGLTQEELAEQAGLSVRQLGYLEGNRHVPRLGTIRRLADALGIGSEGRSYLIAAAGVDERTRDDTGEPAAVPPKVTGLSAPPTAFIGREKEIAEITDLLRRDEVRLLTLIGPGGVGKTRLAFQVASHMLDAFPGGVVSVPLAAIPHHALALSAIAGALNVREQENLSLLDSIGRSLAGRRLLLVIDSFEHLLDAATLIADLLASCPQLKILVTSRAVLRLAAEYEYAVPPLALPETLQSCTPDDAAQYDAVKLFVQRARAVKMTFALTPDNVSAVVEICRRLDGLPLAIELAAARVRVFPPQLLLDRLSSRLALLADGPRDLPARQQTLRATIDWSYRLLGERERVLFARLSVFAGSCTVEAVEAVCNADRDGDTLAGLTALLQHSLLLQQDEDEPRFLMLETIREYGQERLKAAGELSTIRDLHARYYLALAEEAEAMLHGPGGSAWISRLEREHDNLQSALRWAREMGNVALGLRLASALQGFWERRGTVSEGRASLESLLALSGPAEDPVAIRIRARALGAAGELALTLGDTDHSIACGRQSLELARRLDDPVLTTDALVRLGRALSHGGLHAEAAEPLEEGLALARTLGDPRRVAFALFYLGSCRQFLGDQELARNLFDQCLDVGRTMTSVHDLADLLGMLGGRVYSLWNEVERRTAVLEEQLRLSRELGDNRSMAEALNNLAWLACDSNDYERALDLLENSLTRYQKLHDVRGIARQLRYIGWLKRQQGRFAEATQLLEEALRLFQEAGDKIGISRTLLGLGDVARDQGDGARVRAYCEESLLLIRETGGVGARAAIGFSLNNLGLAALYEGDIPKALEYIEEALAIYRDLDEDWGVAETLLSLGTVRLTQDDAEGARASFRDSLMTDESGPPLLLAIMGLEGMAAVDALERRAERAARLFGAAGAFRAKIGFPVWPANRASYDRHLAMARSQLDKATFDALWHEGQTMTRQEAVAYALGG